MKTVLNFVHVILYLCTLALSYNYYSGMQHQVPELMYYVVMVSVIGVSMMIALGHMVGGGLMGLTSGGIWDGMKLGIMLGLGGAVGRLWPYLFIIAGVAFICKGPLWHWLGALVAGGICFAVHYIMSFIWKKVA